MSNWPHKHILDLASFSIKDYKVVLELTNRFNKLPETSSRKLPTYTFNKFIKQRGNPSRHCNDICSHGCRHYSYTS